MKIKSTVWIACIVIPLALVVLLLRFRVERMAVAQEAAQATEKREAAVAPADLPTVEFPATKEGVTDAPKAGSADFALPEILEPEPAKPTIDPFDAKPNDNAPAATDRPIGPIKKANVRIVPVQIQSLRSEVRFTEAYRLKNQDAARIAEVLKRIVPELEITHDPATDSVIIQEMTPKMREFVTEVIQRLSAARQEPLTPQPSTPGATPVLTQPLLDHPTLLPNRSPVPNPYRPVPQQNPTPVIKRDRNEVQDEVRRAFESRQESLRKEVAEFRSRIDRLVQTIKDRERSKDAIIERRVDELLNPNLRWDAAGNSTGGSGSSSSMGSTARYYPLVGYRNLDFGPGTLPLPRPATGPGLRVPNPQPAARAIDVRVGDSAFSLGAIDKGLEFLSQYPRFSSLSLDMTETQFRAFLEQQKLVPQLSIPHNGQLNYSVPLGDGNRLTVMFGLDGKCRGIVPISGAAPSPILPHPASPASVGAASVRAEKVVSKIFRLEQVDAAGVAKTLQELASEKPFSARISADVTSNSVIVFANPDDMPVIEAVIKRLDVAPELPNLKAEPKSSDGPRTTSPDDASARGCGRMEKSYVCAKHSCAPLANSSGVGSLM